MTNSAGELVDWSKGKRGEKERLWLSDVMIGCCCFFNLHHCVLHWTFLFSDKYSHA